MLNTKKHLLQVINVWGLNLLLLSLFLFKTPNFYIIPFFQNSLLTTQAIARFILVLIFIFKLLDYYLQDKQIPLIRNPLVNLIVLFFIIQSLSILYTINLTAFLIRYKDIFVGLVAFFTLYFYRQYLNNIFLVLSLSIFFNSLYQLLAIFNKPLFANFVNFFIYQRHGELVLANLNRERIYTDTYDEMLIPLLLVLTQRKVSNLPKLVYYLLIPIISFFSFTSNFRSRILMLLVSVLGSLFLFRRVGIKKLILILVCIFITGYLVSLTFSNLIGFSFYDRLTLANIQEDVSPISSRITQISYSLDLGKSNLLGVGLGNFYDNLPTSKTDQMFSASWRQVEFQGAAEYVHNIFASIVAESGFPAIFVFIVILLFFIKNDITDLRSNDYYKKALIICFWSLFSYGLFNPIVPASYQVLFWGLRGLLIDK